MPRRPRIHYPGAVYHVILRGNAGQPVFFKEHDHVRFYQFLQESVEHFHHRIHGFCCMTNHVHLIVQVADSSLSTIMQNLSLRYTKWINFSQQRTGHVFQGRFKALLVDADEYLLELVRYVHLNPVRAGIVKTPEEYRWSGHHAYLGKECLPWLTTEWVLTMLSPTKQSKRKAYRDFIANGMDEERRSEFYSGTCEGRILGDDGFVDDALFKGNQQQSQEWTLTEIVSAVCNRYGIRQEQLKTAGKGRPFGKARAVAAAIVLESPHLSLTELGQMVGRNVSALSKAAQRLLLLARTDLALAEEIKTIRELCEKCPNVEPDPSRHYRFPAT